MKRTVQMAQGNVTGIRYGKVHGQISPPQRKLHRRKEKAPMYNIPVGCSNLLLGLLVKGGFIVAP